MGRELQALYRPDHVGSYRVDSYDVMEDLEYVDYPHVPSVRQSFLLQILVDGIPGPRVDLEVVLGLNEGHVATVAEREELQPEALRDRHVPRGEVVPSRRVHAAEGRKPAAAGPLHVDELDADPR